MLASLRSRRAVRPARESDLLARSLAEALRETAEAGEVALLACRRLLCDGFCSPLYAGRADDLRRELGRVRFVVSRA